jgi:uncharacterized protein YndB with AHSA1/START domain
LTEVDMNEVTAEATVDIDAPRSDVWRSLTEPERIKEYYLGADVQTDWQVGSPITFKGEWEGKPYEDKGEILAFEPERKLAYSHWSSMGGKPDAPENYHVVEVTLDERDSATRVNLRQSNLEGGATKDDVANRERYEQTWTQMLDGLKKTAER